MNNTKAFGPRDDIATIGGDISFIGVDELHAPQMVAAGYVSSAKNKRFRFGKCSDREGISLLPWCKGTGTTPFTTVYGGAVIMDPTAIAEDDTLSAGIINEWILIAADGGVWKTRPNQTATPVPLPAGVTLTAGTFTQFIQANAAIVMLRGFNTPPLVCYDLNLGFEAITQENEWLATLNSSTNLLYLPSNNLMIGDPVQLYAVPMAIRAQLAAGEIVVGDSVATTDDTTLTGTVVTLNSLTSTGLIATATAPNHRLLRGQVVRIAGATPTAYNVTSTVLSVTPDSFTFALATAPGGNGTGTMTATELLLPAALVAGQTYYVVATPNANTVALSATPGGDALAWNTSPTDATSYTVVATVLDGAGPIPNASFGIFAQNRLFLINGKDLILASDIGDFTRYQPAIYAFRINQGDSFTLLGLYLYNESTLVLFEDGLVRQVQNVTGDLSGAIGPLNVTQSYGIAAPRGIADSGTDVYWLSSDLRIVNLQMTQLNQTQATDEALSDFLVQTFGRINAAYKANARLAVFGGFLYCALPLDDADLVSPVNLVSGLSWPGPSTPPMSAPIAVTPGKTYQWICGANDAILWDATANVYYQGDCIFTAAGGYVGILCNPALKFPGGPYPVTAQLYEVLAEGVNTAVAVYDFTNNAWCGTDEATGITCVVDWLKLTIGGRQRLCFIGADGYLHLYGDQYDYQFEDEQMLPVATPYVDFFTDAWNYQPDYGTFGDGDTLQVAGGTLITEKLETAVNTASTWGTALPGPGVNLWVDAGGNGGFDAAAINPWSAPGQTISQIPNGVCFTPANGTLPAIAINGTVMTGNVVHGVPLLFTYYADRHSGQQIQSVPISSRVITRGYPCSKLFTQASFQSLSYMSEGLATRFTKAALQLQSWAPKYTINTITQGAGDVENYVTNVTRSRTQNTVHGGATWDPTNVNDDFGDPGWEDYAWADNGGGIYLNDGLDFDQLQEFADRVPVAEAGLWMQIELLNGAGHLELAAVALEAQVGTVDSGPQIK